MRVRNPTSEQIGIIREWENMTSRVAAVNREKGIPALPKSAHAGMWVYQRGAGWGRHLDFEPEGDNEEPVGQVVAVGTWYRDKVWPERDAIIKKKAEFSSQRYRENEHGELELDEAIAIPVTEDGYVYEFLGTLGRGEYASLAGAKLSALDAPGGPVKWEP